MEIYAILSDIHSNSLALNAVGFVACGMVWNASRVFHGRNPNLAGLVLGAIAWIAIGFVILTLALRMYVVCRDKKSSLSLNGAAPKASQRSTGRARKHRAARRDRAGSPARFPERTTPCR